MGLEPPSKNFVFVSELEGGYNAGESTVAELSDGSLMINSRNYPQLIGARSVAVSLTWPAVRNPCRRSASPM